MGNQRNAALAPVLAWLAIACAGSPPHPLSRPAGPANGAPTDGALADAPGVASGHAPTAAGDDTIEVCGQHFRIGTRVVSFREPDGYSAYRRGKHFDRSAGLDGKQRYGVRRQLANGERATLADLRGVVRQFVLHYDAAGTSRQCFKVLQDVRDLSVHFLLDVDGTIYQTLDLRERAFHATTANDCSIGVEIAHPGADTAPMGAVNRTWYRRDADGYRLETPAWMKETGVRTPGFVARPARPAPIEGRINGKASWQFDFTDAQYEALAHLAAGLAGVFPQIELTAPRDAGGAVVDHALSAAELDRYGGLLGHWHVQTNKPDPGPAFDWERLLRRAQQLRGAPGNADRAVSDRAAR